jgi:hypothetical protein
VRTFGEILRGSVEVMDGVSVGGFADYKWSTHVELHGID